MGKTIAVDNISKNMRNQLEMMGYNLVNSSYDGDVDAILYDSKDSSLSYLNVFDNVIDMDKGALLVDVRNKTLDEILDILEKRRYTSFF